MRLFLIRHGQTSWNAEQRAQGHTDIPLDQEGQRQAEMLGESFRGVFVNEVLSSDLIRASRTAQAVSDAVGVPVTVDPRLRERGFGIWEGEKFEVFHKRIPPVDQGMEAVFNFRPPGGESFADVWKRLDSFLDTLRTSHGAVVAVTHGGTCAILLAKLLCGTFETSRSFRFGNSAVVELERRSDGYFTMLRYNDTSHLRSPVLTGDTDGSNK